MSAFSEDSVVALPGAAATAVAWRQREQLHVTVIVKATFAFAPDAAMPLAPAAQPIFRSDVHHGHNRARSVRFGSDLAPYLPQAEVLLTGHAHAPGGGLAESVPVRLTVLNLQAAREWPTTQSPAGAIVDKALLARDPRGFERLALTYEHARGGPEDPDNPLGSAEPKVIDPARPHLPACFAPLGRSWQARKRLLGSTPRKFLEAEIAAIPADFDWTYYQTAPLDQRAPHLAGDEWIVLEGLHPARSTLRTKLPGLRASARVHRLSAHGVPEGQPLDLIADTLRIDADEERCCVVFRRSFPVPDEGALRAVRIVAGVDIEGQPSIWPVMSRSIAPTTLAAGELITVEIDEEAEAPEERDPSPPPAPVEPHHHASSRAKTVVLVFDEETAAPETQPFAMSGPSALPFADARPSAPPPPLDVISPEPFEEEPAPRAAPSPLPPPPAPLNVSLNASLNVSRNGGSREVPIVHHTPFEAALVAWGGEPSRASMSVVVKASCDLVPGGRAALRARAAPLRGEEHAGDDPRASVVYPSDFAPFKVRADVVVRGHAYAPELGARRAEVELLFGHQGNTINRRIAVFGDRRWSFGAGAPRVSEPAPFERVPLVYERAFGGEGDPHNPHGVGRDAAPWPARRASLPNLEDPDHPLRSPAHEPEPACFAPLPRASSQRKTACLADGFDWTRHQAAPRAQRLAFLRGDEPFSISGVLPRRGVLSGSLPAVRARAFARRAPEAGGGFEEIALDLDTVVIDADELALHVLFRGAIPVDDERAPARSLAAIYLLAEGLTDPRLTLEEARARLERR